MNCCIDLFLSSLMWVSFIPLGFCCYKMLIVFFTVHDALLYVSVANISQVSWKFFISVMWCSYNIDWSPFCDNHYHDFNFALDGLYSAITSTFFRDYEVCSFCKLLHCWNERELDVEFCWLLSGQFSWTGLKWWTLLNYMTHKMICSLSYLSFRLQSWVWFQYLVFLKWCSTKCSILEIQNLALYWSC